MRTADPKGERTIFVLTKVDLAEQRKIQKNIVRASSILFFFLSRHELASIAVDPNPEGTEV